MRAWNCTAAISSRRARMSARARSASGKVAPLLAQQQADRVGEPGRGDFLAHALRAFLEPLQLVGDGRTVRARSSSIFALSPSLPVRSAVSCAFSSASAAENGMHARERGLVGARLGGGFFGFLHAPCGQRGLQLGDTRGVRVGLARAAGRGARSAARGASRRSTSSSSSAEACSAAAFCRASAEARRASAVSTDPVGSGGRSISPSRPSRAAPAAASSAGRLRRRSASCACSASTSSRPFRTTAELAPRSRPAALRLSARDASAPAACGGLLATTPRSRVRVDSRRRGPSRWRRARRVGALLPFGGELELVDRGVVLAQRLGRGVVGSGLGGFEFLGAGLQRGNGQVEACPDRLGGGGALPVRVAPGLGRDTDGGHQQRRQQDNARREDGAKWRSLSHGRSSLP